MTAPGTLSSARRTLERLAAPVASRLPLDVGGTAEGAMDRLRPRIWIEPAGGMTTVKLRRSAHASEGSVGMEEEIDLYLLDRQEVEARMQATLDLTAKLLDEDAAIVASGGDPLRPGPEWFTGSAFLIEAARHWGWTPARLVAPCEIAAADGTFEIVRNDGHILTTLLTSDQAGAIAHCARHSWRRHLSCGHLSVMAPNGTTTMAQYSDHDHPAVRLPRNRLPETILAALVGRKVGEVVDDDRLGPIRDLEITGGHNGAGSVTLNVAARTTWMDGREKA